MTIEQKRKAMQAEAKCSKQKDCECDGHLTKCKEIRKEEEKCYGNLRKCNCIIYKNCLTVRKEICQELKLTNTFRNVNGKQGVSRFFWCLWIEVNGQDLSEYTMTFRCDDYERYNKLSNPEEEPFFDERSGNPHDIEYAGRIQFVECRHKYPGTNCSTVTSKTEKNRWWFPSIETNKSDYFCKNRPGKVWPLYVADGAVIKEKDTAYNSLEDAVSNDNDDIKRIISRNDLEENDFIVVRKAYNLFNEDLCGRYFEADKNGGFIGNVTPKFVAKVFQRWILLIECINRMVADNGCRR